MAETLKYHYTKADVRSDILTSENPSNRAQELLIGLMRDAPYSLETLALFLRNTYNIEVHQTQISDWYRAVRDGTVYSSEKLKIISRRIVASELIQALARGDDVTNYALLTLVDVASSAVDSEENYIGLKASMERSGLSIRYTSISRLLRALFFFPTVMDKEMNKQLIEAKIKAYRKVRDILDWKANDVKSSRSQREVWSSKRDLIDSMSWGEDNYAAPSLGNRWEALIVSYTAYYLKEAGFNFTQYFSWIDILILVHIKDALSLDISRDAIDTELSRFSILEGSKGSSLKLTSYEVGEYAKLLLKSSLTQLS
jgi:hypothetical protein